MYMPWKQTTPMEQKIEFICECRSGKYTITDLCENFGISRPTAYKLISRFENMGFDGLRESSRAPRNHPNQTSKKITASILNLKKKYPCWGAKKIRVLLFNELPNEDIPSVVTVHNILGSREDMAGGYSLQKGEHILRSNIKFDYSDVNDTMEFIQQCIVPCGVLRHHTRKASDTFHKN